MQQTTRNRSLRGAESSTPQQTPIRHLTQLDVARRWRLSPRTLERWRYLREGPPYLKIRGAVIYRLTDIEAFEMASLSKRAQ